LPDDTQLMADAPEAAAATRMAMKTERMVSVVGSREERDGERGGAGEWRQGETKGRVRAVGSPPVGRRGQTKTHTLPLTGGLPGCLAPFAACWERGEAWVRAPPRKERARTLDSENGRAQCAASLFKKNRFVRRRGGRPSRPTKPPSRPGSVRKGVVYGLGGCGRGWTGRGRGSKQRNRCPPRATTSRFLSTLVAHRKY
jgi:hypothetical protein